MSALDSDGRASPSAISAIAQLKCGVEKLRALLNSLDTHRAEHMAASTFLRQCAAMGASLALEHKTHTEELRLINQASRRGARRRCARALAASGHKPCRGSAQDDPRRARGSPTRVGRESARMAVARRCGHSASGSSRIERKWPREKRIRGGRMVYFLFICFRAPTLACLQDKFLRFSRRVCAQHHAIQRRSARLVSSISASFFGDRKF